VVASSAISAKEIFVIGMGSVCVLTLGLLFWKYGCCCCGCCFAAVARKSRKSEHGTQVVFGLCEASRQLAGNKAWISQSRMSVGPTTPGGVSYPLPLPAKLPNCESGEFLDDDVADIENPRTKPTQADLSNKITGQTSRVRSSEIRNMKLVQQIRLSGHAMKQQSVKDVITCNIRRELSETASSLPSVKDVISGNVRRELSSPQIDEERGSIVV